MSLISDKAYISPLVAKFEVFTRVEKTRFLGQVYRFFFSFFYVFKGFIVQRRWNTNFKTGKENV